MTNISSVPDPTQAEARNRIIPLLLVAPICSIVLIAILYLLLSPLIPSRMAIHVGPDGVALGTIFCIVGVDQDEVSGSSVGMGLLGFLLLFTVAACVYVAAFPRAKMETLG